MFSLRIQRRTSLLALFVLLWGLVFPTLANAGVGDTNAVWAEICTAKGIQKVQLDTADPTPAAAHQYTAEHCELCCLGGVLAALEPLPLLQGLSIAQPALFLPTPHAVPFQQHILLSAPPRAPPVLSLA